MGAWGTGLYAGDFAQDLKAAISAVCRLPLAEEQLVEAICQSEAEAAGDPANEDHTIFWLVLADQFEKRRIFSRRVQQTALAIIDDGKDAATMQALGMQPGDIRKRAAKLAELRARLAVQPKLSVERKTIKAPLPYVFEQYGVYAYPVRGGEPINPYLPATRFDRASWHPEGFLLMLILSRGRAFGYLPWYVAAKATQILPAVPNRATVAADVRWTATIYGTCNPTHFKKLELTETGIFQLDPARVDHFFPHLATGIIQAVSDISIANDMELDTREMRHAWRRPDGKLERIVYPPAPNLLELGAAQ
ncbi:MAG TPA: hypothetical protein VGQ90_07020 [Stellaceae bacterium]|jgi:hypothetical protein|nr:hypothetical protein [Stellaceae bacterium]